jgi:hypothetical protein
LIEIIFTEAQSKNINSYTVQQIETHGNKDGSHYAGLVESDER